MTRSDTELDRRWREGLNELSAPVDVDDAPRRVAARVSERRRRRRTAAALASVVALAGVASVALVARDDGSSVTTGSPETEPTPLHVEVDNFHLRLESESVPTGPVEVELVNTAPGQHVLVIEGVEGFELSVEGEGDRDVGTVDLEPGTYRLKGDLPGHQQAGEETTLVVTDD